MRDQITLINIALCGLLLLFHPFGREAVEIPVAEVEANPYFEGLARSFDTYFQQQMRYTGTPGAAVAIIQGETVYLMRGYGIRKNQRGERDSVNSHTVFRIGSLSKGFAGVLAGTFVEDGDLAWEDKLRDYLPGFSLRNRANGADVTLAHILSHSSGMGYHAYTDLIEAGWDMEDILPMFGKAKLAGEPGQVYSYQNAIFSLVGKVMEQQTGQPLDSIYEERIFGPLKMEDASVTFEGIDTSSNRAWPHKFKQYWKPQQIHKKYYNAVPAGGVNASISDMVAWMQLLLGQRPEVLEPETLGEIFTPRINTHARRKYFSRWRNVKEAHYGLGWRIVHRPQDTLAYHGGYVNGFKSEILIHPADKVGICILTNANSNLSGRAIPYFLDKYDALRKSIIGWKKEEEEMEDEPTL